MSYTKVVFSICLTALVGCAGTPQPHSPNQPLKEFGFSYVFPPEREMEIGDVFYYERDAEGVRYQQPVCDGPLFKNPRTVPDDKPWGGISGESRRGFKASLNFLKGFLPGGIGAGANGGWSRVLTYDMRIPENVDQERLILSKNLAEKYKASGSYDLECYDLIQEKRDEGEDVFLIAGKARAKSFNYILSLNPPTGQSVKKPVAGNNDTSADATSEVKKKTAAAADKKGSADAAKNDATTTLGDTAIDAAATVAKAAIDAVTKKNDDDEGNGDAAKKDGGDKAKKDGGDKAKKDGGDKATKGGSTASTDPCGVTIGTNITAVAGKIDAGADFSSCDRNVRIISFTDPHYIGYTPISVEEMILKGQMNRARVEITGSPYVDPEEDIVEPIE